MRPFFIWISIPLDVIINIPQKKSRETISIEENETVATVISKLNYDLDTVVILYKNSPIPETTSLSDGMDLTLLEITSKG